MTSIHLGDLVKDKISGFKGVVTSRTEFLNGCIRLGVSPNKLEKEGKLSNTEVFDEEQLTLVKTSVYKRENFIDLTREIPALPEVKATVRDGGERFTPVNRPRK